MVALFVALESGGAAKFKLKNQRLTLGDSVGGLSLMFLNEPQQPTPRQFYQTTRVFTQVAGLFTLTSS